MLHDFLTPSWPSTVTPVVVGIVLSALVIMRVQLLSKQRFRDPQRLFSYAQKQHLIRRAGGRCEHKPPLGPRCSVPGTQADHVVPWSRGGRTLLHNGQLLCLRHNQLKGAWMPTRLYRYRLERRRRRYLTPYPMSAPAKEGLMLFRFRSSDPDLTQSRLPRPRRRRFVLLGVVAVVVVTLIVGWLTGFISRLVSMCALLWSQFISWFQQPLGWEQLLGGLFMLLIPVAIVIVIFLVLFDD